MKKPNRKQRQREIAERNRPTYPVCIHCHQEMVADSLYLSWREGHETVTEWLETLLKHGDEAWRAEATRHAPACVWVEHRGQLIACAPSSLEKPGAVWELSAGSTWALVEPDPAAPGYDRHVCCVELDRGKYVAVTSFMRPLGDAEVLAIVELLREATSDLAEWWAPTEEFVVRGLRSGKAFTACHERLSFHS